MINIKIYIITLDFLKYLLLVSILFDNYKVIYLVNNLNLLNKRSFIKLNINNYIKISILKLLILSKKTKILKNIFNKVISLLIRNLVYIIL